MRNENKATPIQLAKVLSMLYGFLCVFIAIVFFSTGWMSSNTADQRFRAFFLVWIAGMMTIPIVLELLRSLFKSGMNSLAVISIGILNIPFVAMILAVYADLIVDDIADTPILLIVIYLGFAIIGTLSVIFWMIWMFVKGRKSEDSG